LETIRTRKQAKHHHLADLHFDINHGNDHQMTIKEAQEAVDSWIKEYGVRYFSELTNMAVLTEEVGELARIMARRYGEQSWKPTDPRAEDNGRQALGDEMADILWVLLCLANQTGVDLTDEFKKNLEKKTTRDKDRHHQNNKLK
jgi:NTP pyrophosphatase (non-canonical NTP hydrolase)